MKSSRICATWRTPWRPDGSREAEALWKDLEGRQKRRYQTIIKGARNAGEFDAAPATVLDRVVVQLKSSFHETEEARAVRAKRRYEDLTKGRDRFQDFQAAWREALADLAEAGIVRGEKDLLLDYIAKLGGNLKERILQDTRFWPVNPGPGESASFRKAKSWKEAAVIAKDARSLSEASRALQDQTYASDEVYAAADRGKGGRKGNPRDRERSNSCQRSDRGSKGSPKGSKRGGKGARGAKGANGQKGRREEAFTSDPLPSESGGCVHCKRPGHAAKLCPRRAAEKRGEVEGLIADSKRTGGRVRRVFRCRPEGRGPPCEAPRPCGAGRLRGSWQGW